MKLRNPFKKKSKKGGGNGPGRAPTDLGSNSGNQEDLLGGGGAQAVAQSVLQLATQVPEKEVKKSTRKKSSKKNKKKNRGKVPGDKLMKDKNLRGEMEALGGGTANNVYKVAYDHNIGNSGTNKGFWKETKDHGRAASMASSRLDQALGVNMLSNDIEAKHVATEEVDNGRGGFDQVTKERMGITSGMVRGHALKEGKYEDVTEQTKNQYGQQDYMRLKGEVGGVGAEMMGLKFNDKEQKVEKHLGDELMEADFEHHETQRGMANLQLLDYLTAQRDRHEGNIFVDPLTGKVSGIDNDLSFGEQDDSKTFKKGAIGADKVEGLPQQVDVDLGFRVMFMSDAEFLKILEGDKKDTAHLSDAAKEAALDRLHALQAHIDNLYMNDELIYQWNEHTYEDALKSGNGYLARAVEARKKDKAPAKDKTEV